MHKETTVNCTGHLPSAGNVTSVTLEIRKRSFLVSHKKSPFRCSFKWTRTELRNCMRGHDQIFLIDACCYTMMPMHERPDTNSYENRTIKKNHYTRHDASRFKGCAIECKMHGRADSTHYTQTHTFSLKCLVHREHWLRFGVAADLFDQFLSPLPRADLSWLVRCSPPVPRSQKVDDFFDMLHQSAQADQPFSDLNLLSNVVDTIKTAETTEEV